MRFVNETTDQVRVVVRRHISGDEAPKNFVLYPGDEVTIERGTYATDDFYREFEPQEFASWQASKDVDTSPADLTQRDIDMQKKAEGMHIPGSENLPADAKLTTGEMDIAPPVVDIVAPKNDDGSDMAFPSLFADEGVTLGKPIETTNLIGDPSVEAVEQPPVDNDHVEEGAEKFEAPPSANPSVNDLARLEDDGAPAVNEASAAGVMQ